MSGMASMNLVICVRYSALLIGFRFPLQLVFSFFLKKKTYGRTRNLSVILLFANCPEKVAAFRTASSCP